MRDGTIRDTAGQKTRDGVLLGLGLHVICSTIRKRDPLERPSSKKRVWCGECLGWLQDENTRTVLEEGYTVDKEAWWVAHFRSLTETSFSYLRLQEWEALSWCAA